MTKITNKTYLNLINNLKSEIKTARVKAHLAVNQELILLYFRIGKKILEKQRNEGWGTKVTQRISYDLSIEFPDMKGLSYSNIRYMQRFFESCISICPQLVVKLDEIDFFKIPWGHNREIIDSVKNKEQRLWYANQAIENGWILAEQTGHEELPYYGGMNLTLSGWEVFEKISVNLDSERVGFIAMKFNDDALESLVAKIVKPEIQDKLNYRLLDVREVSRAGVIDNIMREQIRDSAFVLADLTHDNSGAYWEAGYAEGLGKPVIYLCEKQKFDEAKTHFDTNHCTTVIWDSNNLNDFKAELIATIRRSLNLFT